MKSLISLQKMLVLFGVSFFNYSLSGEYILGKLNVIVMQ